MPWKWDGLKIVCIEILFINWTTLEVVWSFRCVVIFTYVILLHHCPVADFSGNGDIENWLHHFILFWQPVILQNGPLHTNTLLLQMSLDVSQYLQADCSEGTGIYQSSANGALNRCFAKGLPILLNIVKSFKQPAGICHSELLLLSVG